MDKSGHKINLGDVRTKLRCEVVFNAVSIKLVKCDTEFVTVAGRAIRWLINYQLPYSIRFFAEPDVLKAVVVQIANRVLVTELDITIGQYRGASKSRAAVIETHQR